MTTHETTQKLLSWAGVCLIKHLYKLATKQMWFFLAGPFSPGNICLNKDLQLNILVPVLMIKNLKLLFILNIDILRRLRLVVSL